LVSELLEIRLNLRHHTHAIHSEARQSRAEDYIADKFKRKIRGKESKEKKENENEGQKEKKTNENDLIDEKLCEA